MTHLCRWQLHKEGAGVPAWTGAMQGGTLLLCESERECVCVADRTIWVIWIWAEIWIPF